MATTTKRRRTTKAIRPDENPEKPKRAQIERIQQLYLKSEPDIVDAVERVIEECGYQTASEGVRHLLRIAVAATPIEGEVRATIGAVRAQMVRFFTTRYWTLLNKLIEEYLTEWIKIDGTALVTREIARFKFERGEISHEEYEATLAANPLEKK